jgi:hypothetical protein
MSEPPSAPVPVVVIPLYKPELTPAEKWSLDRAVELLGQHAIRLVGPRRLQANLDGLARHYGRQVRAMAFDDRYFDGIKGYNSLMRSSGFYKAFPAYTHILLAQTDTLVLRDELQAWCEQDFAYIGAPWFAGGSQPRRPLEFIGVGNGGFSLRRTADFLRVLQRPRHIPNFIKARKGGPAGRGSLVRRLKHAWLLAYNFEPLFPTSNEDFFWGILVPAACPFFKVPGLQAASHFAFEVEPQYLYAMNGGRLPFGCHAWQRYDRRFWLEVLPELGALNLD